MYLSLMHYLWRCAREFKGTVCKAVKSVVQIHPSPPYSSPKLLISQETQENPLKAD